MEIPVFQMAGALLVGGIVEAVKRAFALDSRFAPLLSIVIGMALGVMWAASGLVVATPVAGAVAGLVAGLTASGLYSGTKAAVRGGE